MIILIILVSTTVKIRCAIIYNKLILLSSCTSTISDHLGILGLNVICALLVMLYVGANICSMIAKNLKLSAANTENISVCFLTTPSASP